MWHWLFVTFGSSLLALNLAMAALGFLQAAQARGRWGITSDQRAEAALAAFGVGVSLTAAALGFLTFASCAFATHWAIVALSVVLRRRLAAEVARLAAAPPTYAAGVVPTYQPGVPWPGPRTPPHVN